MTKRDDAWLRQLFTKEAEGTLSPEEEQLLDEWYSAFDSRQPETVVFEDDAHESQIKERLLNRILDKGFEQEAPVRSINFQKIVRWLSVAAILMLFVGGALVWKFSGHQSPEPESLLVTATGSGKIQKIVLGDGSVIWLNAGSKLSYPKDFSGSRRDVYLEGEAYFDIAHDPTKPFNVHTARLVTHVLGTAFAVTAYKNMATEAVTVIRGKVSVINGRRLLGFLTPDKHMEFDITSGRSLISATAAATAISWRDGQLQFENQDMQDIAGRLGRWYGYSFRFEHQNAQNCRYTASFNSQIPLKQLLKVMKAISLVNYKIDTTQKTVTFLGTGCNK